MWLVPGHCDPTINLYDWYVAVRGGRVEAIWPITARGAVLWSGPPRRTRSIAGQPVAWLEAGAGRPLVLVHGAGGIRGALAAAARRARRRGPSFFAPDLPGHGPLGGRGRPSIAAYAEWLDGFLDAVGWKSRRSSSATRWAARSRRPWRFSRPERLAGLVLIAHGGARLRVVARLVELLRHDPREGQSLIQDLSLGAPAPREAGSSWRASCARGRPS